MLFGSELPVVTFYWQADHLLFKPTGKGPYYLAFGHQATKKILLAPSQKIKQAFIANHGIKRVQPFEIAKPILLAAKTRPPPEPKIVIKKSRPLPFIIIAISGGNLIVGLALFARTLFAKTQLDGYNHYNKLS